MSAPECNGQCDTCTQAKDCPEEKKTQQKKPAIDRRLIEMRMAKIKHKIAVISGKGGVGKTMVTVNLAAALAQRGRSVGVLDADIHGPSVPKMFGISGSRLTAGPPGIFPAVGPLGIRVVSMDFLLPSEETPVIWRGPLKMRAISQFLSDIVWGPLDYLLADLPPGTGDEPLSIMQLLPDMDGVVIVTIPSEVSQIVVKKAVTFSRQLGVPVIGIIENMSGFVCPKCGAEIDIFGSGGGEKISRELNVPFLGKIPIDPRICEDSDAGVPFVVRHPDSPAAKAFKEITDRILSTVESKHKSEG